MDISKFKSSFTNFLRPNLYRVEFDFKKFNASSYANMETISMLCKDAAFPFFTFNLAETHYNGRKHFSAQEIDYDPVNLVFMVDSDGNVLNFLTAWAKEIVDTNYNYGFRDDYIATITISILDQTPSDLIQKATVKLYNAFIVNVDEISLGYDNTNQISEISVSFNFDYAEYII